MKWLGKLLFWLITLILLIVIAAYFLIQTSWGTRQLTQWVNANTSYELSLSNIDHSLSNPSIIDLNDISIKNATGKFALDAKKVELTLNWDSFVNLGWFERIIVQSGSLDVSTLATHNDLPLSSGLLQFNQVNIHRTDDDHAIGGEGIIGGIKPWLPTTNNLIGEGDYQFSAQQFNYDGIPLSNLLVQGNYRKDILTIESFSSTLFRGLLSGNGQRLSDGSWQWNSILLNDLSWQTPMTLNEIRNAFNTIAPIHIKNMNATNLKIEGKNWAINYLDSTLKNISLTNGSWQANDGIIDFNAVDIMFNGTYFSDVIGQLQLNNNILDINNLSSRYEKGLLRFKGNWNRDNRSLNITEGTIGGVIYTLPNDWFNQLKTTLPDEFSSITVKDININNSLIIDITPEFPFQLTGFNGYISQMTIAKDNHWGLWNGEFSFNATNATFNKIELYRPYIKLTATNDMISTQKLDASVGNGLLRMMFSLSTKPEQNIFNFAVRGIEADTNILNLWGWQTNLNDIGNFVLSINGQLDTDNIKQSVAGTIEGSDKKGGRINSDIRAGKIIESNYGAQPIQPGANNQQVNEPPTQNTVHVPESN